MDGPIHTAPAKPGLVGSVDYGPAFPLGNVPQGENQLRSRGLGVAVAHVEKVYV